MYHIYSLKLKLFPIPTFFSLSLPQRKHCLLDVTPHNVDKLNYAQYYPIVVFLKAENKNIVKDCRAKFAKGSTKNHKKLFEQSQKLEKLYPHLFTGKELKL